MRIKYLNYFILPLLSWNFSAAQSLVPNGDFEQFTSCPTVTGSLSFATGWTNPLLGGSPDYLNQCAAPGIVNVPDCTYGYQPAHGGAGMGGISLWSSNTANFRENMEIQLSSPLVANQCYHFEMYVNRGNNGKDTTSDIGVYFSVPFISGMSNLFSFTPQITNQPGNTFDTLNWTLVSGNYMAAGGENYLIIGNLKDDATTSAGSWNFSATYPVAYAYVDDVSLSLCTGLNNLYESEESIVFPNPFSEKINIDI